MPTAGANDTDGLPEPPETVYVVHGEAEASAAVADQVRQRLDCAAAPPASGRASPWADPGVDQ